MDDLSSLDVDELKSTFFARHDHLVQVSRRVHDMSSCEIAFEFDSRRQFFLLKIPNKQAPTIFGDSAERVAKKDDFGNIVC